MRLRKCNWGDCKEVAYAGFHLDDLLCKKHTEELVKKLEEDMDKAFKAKVDAGAGLRRYLMGKHK